MLITSDNLKFSANVSIRNENVFYTEIPFFNGRNFKTSADWNYTTEPMIGLKGRNMDYPEGHILGGTSSLSTFLSPWMHSAKAP